MIFHGSAGAVICLTARAVQTSVYSLKTNFCLMSVKHYMEISCALRKIPVDMFATRVVLVFLDSIAQDNFNQQSVKLIQYYVAF